MVWVFVPLRLGFWGFSPAPALGVYAEKHIVLSISFVAPFFINNTFVDGDLHHNAQ